MYSLFNHKRTQKISYKTAKLVFSKWITSISVCVLLYRCVLCLKWIKQIIVLQGHTIQSVPSFIGNWYQTCYDFSIEMSIEWLNKTMSNVFGRLNAVVPLAHCCWCTLLSLATAAQSAHYSSLANNNILHIFNAKYLFCQLLRANKLKTDIWHWYISLW